MTTISEMKALNKKNGQHWFDKGAMNFFNTKIEASPNKGNYFITSEHTGDNNRKYAIRHFDTKTGKVETVGEVLQYKTLAEAQQARKKL